MKLMRARDVIPQIIPFGWRIVEKREDGAWFVRTDGLALIMSGCVEQDGKRWKHLSISRADQLPSWDDLKTAKLLFLGRDVKAIQVLPPESEYVNINPNVLHLFQCVDGDPLPDFTSGGGSL